MEIKFKKIGPNKKEAKIPKRGTHGAAGYDLYAVSRTYDDHTHCYIYGTGLSFEIPSGHVGLLLPRSSIFKAPLHIPYSVGVIDSDYRGEVRAIFRLEFFTTSNSDIYRIGDRVAQLVIMPVPDVSYVEAFELSKTQRGELGYGSTGLN